MEKTISINGRIIGPGHPTYIVAEISANHNQDFERAKRLIHLAKRMGADAVKLQTYRPDTMTIDCKKSYFSIGRGTTWAGRYLHELYQDAYTPWEWQPLLQKEAASLKLDLFSTPFDLTAVDFLEDMKVPAYKIASFEIVDIPLLKRVAETEKPIFLSTGMASLAEIDEAVTTIRQHGGRQIALLKCTSAYPAPPEEMNLCTISHLSQAFNAPVGLSDHSLGPEVSVAAVALGACVIEKHVTLSRQDPGPDSAFSAEPEEFGSMVQAVRVVEKALGEVQYGTTDREKANVHFRRSLFVVEDMKLGEEFTRENVRSIRPGYGLHPRHLEDILGLKAKVDIERGTPLGWHLIA